MKEPVRRRWRRWSRLAAVLVATVAAFLGVIVAAPAASATCTGAPGCTSGWYGSTWYDSSSGKTFRQSIDVVWYANSNVRRVYSSGSTCYPTYPYLCEGHDYLRIYYRSHCNCTWVLRVTIQPGPPYGQYTYDDLTASNPTQPHDWLVQGCSFGTCHNTPIITN